MFTLAVTNCGWTAPKVLLQTQDTDSLWKGSHPAPVYPSQDLPNVHLENLVWGWGGRCCCWRRARSSGNTWALLIPQGAEPCAGVRAGESSDPWMDRWTERQEEQQCEPQRLVTTHKGLLGEPRGRRTFPAFWFLLILHRVGEKKPHRVFPHFQDSRAQLLPHKAPQGSTLPHPGDGATARPPPWAPTPWIRPLLPPSHLGMSQDSVSLQGWAGKDGQPITTGLLQSWKGLVQRKISLPDQKERFQYILIVKWFLFFSSNVPPGWVSAGFLLPGPAVPGQSLGGRGCTCAEQSPKTHSVLPTPPNTSQATTTTAQDSAQALGRGAGVKN